MMKICIIICCLITLTGLSQNYKELKGKWIAQTDSSENLLVTRDTLVFSIEDDYDLDGCVYLIDVDFNKDTSAFIWPEWWCAGTNWGNHSPYRPKGLLFIQEPGVLRWNIEMWNDELGIFFYGDIFYFYFIKENKLTLIRDKKRS